NGSPDIPINSENLKKGHNSDKKCRITTKKKYRYVIFSWRIHFQNFMILHQVDFAISQNPFDDIHHHHHQRIFD
ncbi:MAG: hypothetical protein KZQ66_20915, partial [Candidatus Thiodiazotropha sp. (ex Lucinoma aequizonata)]|nr:hypothetical protein [Candidatus Thiodiazotropha sp. (ex Lucinoma aequizonata)]